jgi:hypothetical protein
VVAGAKAMALTVVDLWTDPVLLDGVKQEFSRVASAVDVLGVTQ